MKPTPSHSLLPQTAAEELIVAQALALYRDSKQAAKSAPHGQFLNHAEAAVITKGWEFIRHSLQTLIQEEIHDIEKKKRRQTLSEVPNEKTAPRIPKQKHLHRRRKHKS